MKLDRGPWTGEKLKKKTAKQALWIALALYTGFTFVGYFVPIRELAVELATFSANPWAVFWVLFYGFATYGNAGFMREQVCKYMCPYARFQSAMFDNNTLIVTYDEERGEPRGARRRGVEPREQGLGDCIDCTLCVQVCPTGIDIRKGLQYECIACAACVDACDGVMDKMHYPRGLIRWSTENALRHKGYRLFRPRTIVYSGILVVLLTALVSAVIFRSPVILDVIRDRNTLYRDVGRAGIENSFTVRVINKHNRDERYRLSVTGLPGIRLDTPADIAVGAESVVTVPVSIIAPHEVAVGGNTIEFSLQSLTDSTLRVIEESRFRGPEED